MQRERVNSLPRVEKLRLLALLKEKQRREKHNKIKSMFPDEGEFRRELYGKHLAFFTAGAYHRERLFMAGNRVGKTEGGGTEATYHLTGNYPAWWTGRVFKKPIRAMVAGDTSETTRDILQKKLLGGRYGTEEWGTGLIPLECLGKPILKQGVSGGYSEVPIKYKSKGEGSPSEWSSLKFRSYDQGRRIFQGQELEFFWADEECPYEVYEEGLLRTATTDGMVILTFTPLTGLTPLVLSFLESRKDQKLGAGGGRYVVQAGWDDVPHLNKEEMAELEKSIMPHQRAARRKGEPSLGAGAIYPIDKADFEVKPFMIPRHWPKGYALDVGWNKTAAVWGAWDREADIVYLYSEHYMGRAVPSQHVDAIKGRGEWILGTIDPAAKGRSQADGKRLIEAYEDGGLNIVPADNAVEAGIYEVWSRLSTGRLKVCSNLSNWFSEFGLYRRNEHGKIVKENDHIMDATRYLIMMLIKIMTSPPPKDSRRDRKTGDWRS
jgi:phage terminase large subunit-like protein